MPDASPSTRHALEADEWRRQAVRDLAAARHLVDGGFLSPAVALAHLAVEKALKALYRAQADATPPAARGARFAANPPVSHDLAWLATATDLTLPADLRDALRALDATGGILALYPDGLLDAPLATDRPAARAHVAAAAALLDWIGDHGG
jgi:HEPN domain-containing protein